MGNDLLIHTDSQASLVTAATARTVHDSFFATQPLSMNVSGMEGGTLERQTSPFSQAYERAGGAAVLLRIRFRPLGRVVVSATPRVSGPSTSPQERCTRSVWRRRRAVDTRRMWHSSGRVRARRCRSCQTPSFIHRV